MTSIVEHQGAPCNRAPESIAARLSPAGPRQGSAFLLLNQPLADDDVETDVDSRIVAVLRGADDVALRVSSEREPRHYLTRKRQ